MCNFSNCCQFCQNAKLDIDAFKNGYGETGKDKFSPQALKALQDLRAELCKRKSSCTKPDCCAQELIDIIDNDPDINGKI